MAEGAYEYAIDSVDNAVHALLMLRQRSALRVTDVAAELGVARSTAHRIVSTLVQSGMLRRNDADRSYGPGPALVELGMAVIGVGDLRAEIGPVLAQLAGETRETTHLLVRDRDEVVFAAVAEGTYVIRAASRVGSRLPAHVTSAGKVMLAAMPHDDLLALYPGDFDWRAGGTDAALHSRKQLMKELEVVAAQGWAVNRSESEEGLIAVSAPVRDPRGTVIGAVSISGPAERMAPRVAETATTLKAAIARFEKGLGATDGR